MEPMSNALAVVVTLLSALALYAGSPNCAWHEGRRLRAATGAGLVLALVALAIWIGGLGVATGLPVMLAAWMLALVLLPYLAVWSREATLAGRRAPATRSGRAATDPPSRAD